MFDISNLDNLNNKYFKLLPNSPVVFSETPFEYTKCKSADSVSTYGVIVENNNYKLDELIESVSEYKNLEHIGEQDESYVFSIGNSNGDLKGEEKVLKCFYYYKYSTEYKSMKCLQSGKNIPSVVKNPIKDYEIEILKNLFSTSKFANMCEVLDMFYLYIINRSKKMVYYNFCFVTPKYTPLNKLDYSLLSETQKLKIIKDLIHGVYDLHTMGYYHGDLKTQNICVDSNLRTRLIDFGTAYPIENTIHYERYKNTVNYASPKAIYNLMSEYDYKQCKELDDAFLKRNIKIKKEDVVEVYIKKEENKKPTPVYQTVEQKTILEHGIPNDLFVIGLIIGEMFATEYSQIKCFQSKEGKQHQNKFFQYYHPWSSSSFDKNMKCVEKRIIDFLKDPKKYAHKYYKRVGLPKFIRPLFEECINNYNCEEESASVKNTERVLSTFSKLNLASINNASKIKAQYTIVYSCYSNMVDSEEIQLTTRVVVENSFEEYIRFMTQHPLLGFKEVYPYEDMMISEVQSLPVKTLVNNFEDDTIKILYIIGPNGVIYEKNIETMVLNKEKNKGENKVN